MLWRARFPSRILAQRSPRLGNRVVCREEIAVCVVVLSVFAFVVV